MSNIVISVVCYNNEEEIIFFVEQLSKQTVNSKLCILITCNKCENPERFIQELSEINAVKTFVYIPNSNMGYLNGCLYGLSKYSKNHNYEWAMISNTDIIFNGQDFFERFIENEKNKNIWCIGPDIILSNLNFHQNPFLFDPPSMLKIIKWKLSFSNLITYNIFSQLSDIKHRYFNKRSDNLYPCYVYAVHGSCFFLKKQCIEKLLGEKIEIFMYEEELFIAELIKKNQKKEFFDNTFSVIHNENQITGTIDNEKKQKWMKESFDFLYKNYY